LNSLEYPSIDEFLDFGQELKPLIQKANEIGDFLWGDVVQNKFKSGALEGIIDFREAFKKMEMDVK